MAGPTAEALVELYSEVSKLQVEMSALFIRAAQTSMSPAFFESLADLQSRVADFQSETVDAQLRWLKAFGLDAWGGR